MTAVILFAHGSTVASANEACRRVTAAVAERCGLALTDTAFLDCAAPTLAEAVASAAARGAARVVVIPYFLTLGIHLQRDLPNLIGIIEAAHPGLEIAVTDPLDGHPALLDIVSDRARSAFNGGSDRASTAG